MGLSLVVGPAHAGKVALLLDRFVERLDSDPWLVVPTRGDVDRVERELARRLGALLTGRVGTFDSLFEHLARSGDGGRRVIGDAERAILVRRAVAAVPVLAGSGGFPGVADALATAIGEVEANLVDHDTLDLELASLARAYGVELESVGAWDRAALRRRALERLTGELGAWNGAPVLAYGFEDLTAAEWRLLEALAARGDVHVSLPYEPARPVFASLQRTATDLSALAGSNIVELVPAADRFLPGPLSHLERELFQDAPVRERLDGTVLFLEGAGRRGTLELVAEHVLELIAGGTPPHEIGVVSPSLDRLRVSLETAFGSLGVPFAVEARSRLGSSPFGQAMIALLRFAWAGSGRRELFRFLRTRYAGIPRADADWLEGRLRGRAVSEHDRVLEEIARLRGERPLIALDLVRDTSPAPLAAVRKLSAAMLAGAYGRLAPPTSATARRDLRVHDAVLRVVDELEAVSAAGIGLGADDVLAALDRGTVPGDRPGEEGRVAVLDLQRARTRQFEVVVVLGLEQGSLPRRAATTPLLDDETRRSLDLRSGTRLERADAASRDRYLFYTACTRGTRKLVLVREAVNDEGAEREPSPFWDAVRALYEPADVRLHTQRRQLSQLTWALESAPTERERLRSVAAIGSHDPDEAIAIARANGWARKLMRARSAFWRQTTVSHPRAIALVGGTETFRVTDLERMAGCSAAWFVERYLRPGQIDQEIDARMRGSIAHVALQRFYTRLPSAVPGAERVTPENVDNAVRLMHECVESALESGLRIDAPVVARRELAQSLRRDLERLVRDEAEASSTFVPRKLEASFSAFELEPGIAVSGKIDRVDADPLSARGIVVDYKSGAAPTAVQIRDELRLQIPLYLLVLRDQLGLEPMGGVYVPVGGGRRPRGMLRGGEDAVPGFAAADYLDGPAFDEQMEHARSKAVELAGRIRAGDVRHDPRGGECPAWCDLWRICRKERP
jgi:ATP-dependent helicase/nuclease subunit B